MNDCTLRLSSKDYRDIERIGREYAAQNGLPPVTVDDMALELLRGHLVLIRECPEILPNAKPAAKVRPLVQGRIRGKGGVSLRDGVNGKP